MKKNRPKFLIVRNSQKRTEDFSETFSPDILTEISLKITGEDIFDVEFDDALYNKGRLAKLFFNESIYYISISPVSSADGRNYWFQSVPSALTQFFNEKNKNKNFYYYINNVSGNISTSYFDFMYRLMKTSGVHFLNDKNILGKEIEAFYTMQDMITAKENIRSKNKSNKSSYITMDENGSVQIFAKTYGANKKESSMICFAISQIHTGGVKIYQISEGNLTVLPEPDMAAIRNMMDVQVIISSEKIERDEFVKNDSLRSPTFIFNLLEKLGQKKCEMCDCSIPQIVQAAHVWPVSEIKKSSLSDEEKLFHATHRDNGFWLCENHHKLLDRNIIILSENGSLMVMKNIDTTQHSYLSDITKNHKLLSKTRLGDFMSYLKMRNRNILKKDYKHI